MQADETAMSPKLPSLPWWARPSSVSRLENAGLWSNLSKLPLNEFDAVHAETIITAPFAAQVHRSQPRATLVIDLPDIASHYRARNFVNNRRGWAHPRALHELFQIGKLYGLEHSLFRAAGTVFVCSEIDAERIRHWVPGDRVVVVPNCTNVAAPLAPAAADGKSLVFVGTMSYQPNEEAIRYFCRSVWPLVRREVQGAQFWVVGKSPSNELMRITSSLDGVHVTGEVPDVKPYLAQSVASVVPLLTGGGTRLKILESMAAHRAVVSTSIGAEGIDARDGEHILLADTPETLAAKCVRMLCDRPYREEIAAAGRRLVEEKYDWRAAQQQVLNRYREMERAHSDVANGL